MVLSFFFAGCFSLQSPSAVKQKSDDRTVLEVAPSGHQLNRPSAHGFGDSLAQLKAAGHQLNLSLAHQLLDAFSPTPGDTFELGEKLYLRSTMQEALHVDNKLLQLLLHQFTDGLGAGRKGFLTLKDILEGEAVPDDVLGSERKQRHGWFKLIEAQFKIKNGRVDFCAFALSQLSKVVREKINKEPCYDVLNHPIDVQSAPPAQVTARSGGEALVLGGGSLDTFDLGSKSYRKSEVQQILQVSAGRLEQLLTRWEHYGAGEKGFITVDDLKASMKADEPQKEDVQIDHAIKRILDGIVVKQEGKIDFCAFAYWELGQKRQKFSMRDCYSKLDPPASKIDRPPSTPEVQTSLPAERSPDETLIQLVINLGVALGRDLSVPQWVWDRDVVETYWGAMKELKPDDNDLITIDSLLTAGREGIDPKEIAVLKEDLGVARPENVAAERDGKMDLCEFALWFKMIELSQEFPVLANAAERQKILRRCYAPAPDTDESQDTIVLKSGATYSKSDILSLLESLGQQQIPDISPYAVALHEAIEGGDRRVITLYEEIEGGDREGYITEAHLRRFAEKAMEQARQPADYVKRLISASKCFEDCDHRIKFYPEFLVFAAYRFGERSLVDLNKGCCYLKDKLDPVKKHEKKWLKFFNFVAGAGNCYITESGLRKFFELLQMERTLAGQQIARVMSKAKCGPDNARINFDPEFVELAVEPEFSKIRRALRAHSIDV